MTIDFEQDQREDLNSVNDAKSLSDQVVKLKSLEDELEDFYIQEVSSGADLAIYGGRA